MLKTYRHIAILILAAMILPGTAMAQYKNMKDGEKLYDKEDYTASAQKFNIASANEKNVYADYNAANALSKNGNFLEAIRRYNSVVESNADAAIRSQAFYNMGNNFLAMENYKEGVEAYKNALRLNPQDEDARHNYLYAQQLLQMQQQQQEQQQGQEESGDESSGESSEENQQSTEDQGEISDSDDSDSEEELQEAEDQGENADQGQNSPGMQANNEEMSKLEAERLLEMIQKRDEEIHKQLIQKKGGKSPSTKQW